MEIYSTEEQQEEAIKKAIKDNWATVLIGAAIGLAGVYGWRYYNESQIIAREVASDGYVAIVEQVGKDNVDVLALANQYVEKHGDSAYTVMIALVAAKEAAEKNQLDEAVKQLKLALAHTEAGSFKGVIAVRLARVQAEQEKFDDALATINMSMPTAFNAQAEELKGDIYVKQGNVDKARVAYLAAAKDGVDDNQGLQRKLDNLAVETTTK